MEISEHVKDYHTRIGQALIFAGNAEGEVWDGLFLMGLAMADLDLLPESTLVQQNWYWIKAPASKAELPTWQDSRIIERNAFHGRSLNESV